jgi:hypothetical protein
MKFGLRMHGTTPKAAALGDGLVLPVTSGHGQELGTMTKYLGHMTQIEISNNFRKKCGQFSLASHCESVPFACAGQP